MYVLLEIPNIKIYVQCNIFVLPKGLDLSPKGGGKKKKQGENTRIRTLTKTKKDEKERLRT